MTFFVSSFQYQFRSGPKYIMFRSAFALALGYDDGAHWVWLSHCPMEWHTKMTWYGMKWYDVASWADDAIKIRNNNNDANTINYGAECSAIIFPANERCMPRGMEI